MTSDGSAPRIWATGLTIGAVVLIAIGCGSSDGDDPATDAGQSAVDASRLVDAAPAMPDAGPVAASAFCQQLTTILCNAEQACCGNAGSKHATFDECFAAQNPGCLTDLQALATDSQTGYDPVTARAELDELAGRTAACDVDIGPWFISRQGLLGVFRGTVASGGDCSPSSASDRGPVLSCNVPSVCRLTPLPLNGTCGAPRSSGDSCVTEIECTEGLRCDPPESLTGTCKARLPDGSGCTVNGDCTSLICEASSCVARTADRVYCFKQQ